MRLLGLGAVIAGAVMVGILGAALALSSVLASRQPVAQATPTGGYVESMKPIAARVDVLKTDGYPIAADPDGARAITATSAAAQPMIDAGTAFFLVNGTLVQITALESPLARVQVMSGPHANRVGWLPVNATSTR